MKSSLACLTLVTLLAFGTLAVRSATSTKATDTSERTNPGDVSDSIRKSLDHAGHKGVTASHDHGKGVVTLSRQVEMDRAKSEAESIAKSMASGQIVSNQIAVMGSGHMGDRSRERRPESPR